VTKAKVVLILFAAVLCLVVFATANQSTAGPAAAGVPTSTSTLSIEPTSTPVPCPLRIVKRTRVARATAIIAWERNAEVRDCFDRPPHARLPQLPARSEQESVWRAALTRYHNLTAQYKAERKMLRHKMRNPGQPVNGERWRPLALYVGWTRAEWPTVLYVMAKRGGTGESGGWPLAFNKSSGCAGLMQLHPMFYTGQWAIQGVKEAFNWRDPEVNLRKAEGVQDDSGWGPWALN